MNRNDIPKSTSAPDLSLTENEQALLRAALSSNTSPYQADLSPKRSSTGASNNQKASTTGHRQSLDTMGSYSSDMYSPAQGTYGQLDGFEADTSPLLDFDLEDGNFDWDNTGMIGDLPALSNGDNGDHHDKRKKSIDDDDGHEASGKRREGEEKTSARKPGRKPLTGEPTTKRKAQNRAAQRAFRERKERHLKELEMKVEDLEKASESTNHENGRLRAQVARLNTEVKEYRKRLSLTAPGVGRSPPTATPVPYTYNTGNHDFQFAFPKFGDLPNSIFGSNGSLVKTSSPVSFDNSSNTSVPSLARASSSQSPPTKSPTSINGNYGSTLTGTPNTYQSPSDGFQGNGIDELNGLFSPSILESAKRNAAGGYGLINNVPRAAAAPRKTSSTDSYNALANLHNFNSNSTGSPSASSMSHGGLESSCGTTPEPSADSPGHRKQSEGALNTINEELGATEQGKENKCSEWVQECDKSTDPIPRTMYDSNAPSAPSSTMKSSEFNNGIDWLAQQNGGQFDPVLFGDYRDPQDNIMNSNLGDFFGDAFFAQDFGTPFNTGELPSEPQHPQQTMSPQPAPPKTDVMKECEVAQNANDEPAAVVKEEEKARRYITCDKIWDRVQNSEKVNSGEYDMDDLCSQLKAKAKCSGQGAVIDEAEVDRILGPPTPQEKRGFMNQFMPVKKG